MPRKDNNFTTVDRHLAEKGPDQTPEDKPEDNKDAPSAPVVTTTVDAFLASNPPPVIVDDTDSSSSVPPPPVVTNIGTTTDGGSNGGPTITITDRGGSGPATPPLPVVTDTGTTADGGSGAATTTPEENALPHHVLETVGAFGSTPAGSLQHYEKDGWIVSKDSNGNVHVRNTDGRGYGHVKSISRSASDRLDAIDTAIESGDYARAETLARALVRNTDDPALAQNYEDWGRELATVAETQSLADGFSSANAALSQVEPGSLQQLVDITSALTAAESLRERDLDPEYAALLDEYIAELNAYRSEVSDFRTARALARQDWLSQPGVGAGALGDLEAMGRLQLRQDWLNQPGVGAGGVGDLEAMGRLQLRQDWLNQPGVGAGGVGDLEAMGRLQLRQDWLNQPGVGAGALGDMEAMGRLQLREDWLNQPGVGTGGVGDVEAMGRMQLREDWLNQPGVATGGVGDLEAMGRLQLVREMDAARAAGSELPAPDARGRYPLPTTAHPYNPVVPQYEYRVFLPGKAGPEWVSAAEFDRLTDELGVVAYGDGGEEASTAWEEGHVVLVDQRIGASPNPAYTGNPVQAAQTGTALEHFGDMAGVGMTMEGGNPLRGRTAEDLAEDYWSDRHISLLGVDARTMAMETKAFADLPRDRQQALIDEWRNPWKNPYTRTGYLALLSGAALYAPGGLLAAAATGLPFAAADLAGKYTDRGYINWGRDLPQALAWEAIPFVPEVGQLARHGGGHAWRSFGSGTDFLASDTHTTLRLPQQVSDAQLPHLTPEQINRLNEDIEQGAIYAYGSTGGLKPNVADASGLGVNQDILRQLWEAADSNPGRTINIRLPDGRFVEYTPSRRSALQTPGNAQWYAATPDISFAQSGRYTTLPLPLSKIDTTPVETAQFFGPEIYNRFLGSNAFGGAPSALAERRSALRDLGGDIRSYLVGTPGRGGVVGLRPFDDAGRPNLSISGKGYKPAHSGSYVGEGERLRDILRPTHAPFRYGLGMPNRRPGALLPIYDQNVHMSDVMFTPAEVRRANWQTLKDRAGRRFLPEILHGELDIRRTGLRVAQSPHPDAVTLEYEPGRLSDRLLGEGRDYSNIARLHLERNHLRALGVPEPDLPQRPSRYFDPSTGLYRYPDGSWSAAPVAAWESGLLSSRPGARNLPTTGRGHDQVDTAGLAGDAAGGVRGHGVADRGADADSAAGRIGGRGDYDYGGTGPRRGASPDAEVLADGLPADRSELVDSSDIRRDHGRVVILDRAPVESADGHLVLERNIYDHLDRESDSAGWTDVDRTHSDFAAGTDQLAGPRLLPTGEESRPPPLSPTGGSGLPVPPPTGEESLLRPLPPPYEFTLVQPSPTGEQPRPPLPPPARELAGPTPPRLPPFSRGVGRMPPTTRKTGRIDKDGRAIIRRRLADNEYPRTVEYTAITRNVVDLDTGEHTSWTIAPITEARIALTDIEPPPRVGRETRHAVLSPGPEGKAVIMEHPIKKHRDQANKGKSKGKRPRYGFLPGLPLPRDGYAPTKRLG